MIIIAEDDYSDIDVYATSHITFNIFKKFYAINQRRFVLYPHKVTYYTGDSNVCLVFRNPVDKLRYKLFRRQIERDEKLNQDKILHDIMLKNLQDDINNL